MNRRSILAGAVIMAGLSTSVLGAKPDLAALKSLPAQASPAHVQEMSLDGVVEALRQATLSAQVAGAIVSVNVKAGDRVRAGQVLLRMDARAAQQNVVGSNAQLEVAQANWRVASKELERQKQLFQQQYISQAALERAQAQVDAAQAQVNAQQAQSRAAQTQTGFFSVMAPFHGVVSEVSVTWGDMAMPGRALLTMHDPSALRVSVAVPQSMIEAVRQQPQTVRYDIAGRLSGAASQVQLLPAVDPVTHTTTMRVMLPAGTEGLVPGLFARVWVPTSAVHGATSNSARATTPSDRVFLPQTAIVRRAEMTGVYVKDAQGQPRLRQVRLGRTTAQTVEVLSGVSAGEHVVTEPVSLGKKL